MKPMKRNTPSVILWPLVALAVILLFNLFFTPGFFHIEIKDGHLFGSLIDILKRAAPVMMLSIGMTFVIATKGIDISVGSTIAIAGAIAVILINTYQSPLGVIIIAALAAAIGCGIFNGFLVAFIGIQPIVATLILMVMGRGIAQLITGGDVLYFKFPPFEFIGLGYVFGIPFPIILAALLLVMTYLLVTKNPIGLFIQAVGGNAEASRYSGINARLVIFLVYVFSGFLAGIAGLVLTSDIKGADAAFVGLWIELDAILSVVIGGTPLSGGKFNVFGSVIGALIIQSLTTTILTRGVPVQFTLVVKAFVVVTVLLLQSEAFRQKVFRLKTQR